MPQRFSHASLELSPIQYIQLVSITIEESAYFKLHNTWQHRACILWYLPFSFFKIMLLIYFPFFFFCMYLFFFYLLLHILFHCVTVSQFVIPIDSHLGCYECFTLWINFLWILLHGFAGVQFHLSWLNAKEWNHT